MVNKKWQRIKIDEKKGSRNIKLLGASSLANDLGSEMVTPVLPFYISSLGGSGVAIGALSGLREGLSSLFKLLGGWASDRLGKRMKFVFAGYLISVLSRIVLAFAKLWQSVMFFASVERLGKLRDAPRDAIISQSTKKRGRGFGIHQAFDTAGGVLGTLVVIFLLWKFGMNFKLIILIAALLSSLSLIPLFFVKEPKIKPEKTGLLKGVKQLDKNLKYFVFVAAVFMLANFGLYMFMILLVKEYTGNFFVPLAFYALFSLAFALFAIPFGKLSDKLGRKKILLGGYLLFLLLAFSFVFMSGLVFFAAAFVAYGLVYAMTIGNQRAFASDLSGKMKGTAMGFFYFVTGLVNIFGGIIAGILWEISYRTMFAYLSAVALIAVVLLVFVREKR